MRARGFDEQEKDTRLSSQAAVAALENHPSAPSGAFGIALVPPGSAHAVFKTREADDPPVIEVTPGGE